jgi:hypothetical protein
MLFAEGSAMVLLLRVVAVACVLLALYHVNAAANNLAPGVSPWRLLTDWGLFGADTYTRTGRRHLRLYQAFLLAALALFAVAAAL